MTKIVLFFVVLLTGSWSKTVSSKISNDEELDWWKTAVFYQIYPRSFKDSNNDGIGDLQGIIQKMDHFTDLGVDAIWLSPIYKSPMVDGGYDISDYRDIAPEYGTLDNFKELLKESHDNGIKVIMDFVPNHSSDQHEWFNKSVNREEGYEDYYLWADGKIDQNGKRVPPNNWLSVWRNSGWTWNEQRQQYYFHQFSDKQPDFNYHNDRVREEMKDILKYWLDMGVDGVRIDAVPHIYEDIQLRDEPVDPSNNGDPNDYNYLNHVYTRDQPETFDVVYSWRKLFDDYTKTHGGSTRVIMTESATDIDTVVRYYGNKDGSVLGAHFSFNFYFLGMSENSRATDIRNTITTWQNALPAVYTFNWLTGNHDSNRIASRVGSRNIDGYNALLFFLPGVTISYMGEEIGQEDGEVTCEQGQDPSAIGNCTTFDQVSRDFERTPFQWDDSVNAGFNEGAKTWLPVSPKYHQTNLASQKESPKSHYQIYKELVSNKNEFMLSDAMKIDESDPDVLYISRTITSGKKEFILIFNMGTERKSIPIKKSFNSETYWVLIGSENSDYTPGEAISEDEIDLESGGTVILRNF